MANCNGCLRSARFDSLSRPEPATARRPVPALRGSDNKGAHDPMRRQSGHQRKVSARIPGLFSRTTVSTLASNLPARSIMILRLSWSARCLSSCCSLYSLRTAAEFSLNTRKARETADFIAPGCVRHFEIVFARCEVFNKTSNRDELPRYGATDCQREVASTRTRTPRQIQAKVQVICRTPIPMIQPPGCKTLGEFADRLVEASLGQRQL